MNEIFITDIHIDKVRHLKNIDIEISKSTKKHLILTGPNGSGKTSVMEALKSYMPIFADDNYNFLINTGSRLKQYEQELEQYKKENNIVKINEMNRRLSDAEAVYKRRYNGARVDISDMDLLNNLYNTGDFILAYLPADRSTVPIDMPESIKTVDIEQQQPIDNHATKDFAKYMLFLNYQKLSAMDENNTEEANRIKNWFQLFENALKEVYNCPELKLVHYSKELSFKIELPNREPFGFNEMADGYSSFLNIVMELIIRMENKASMKYDTQGIVLIDEIETHLHIKLQKNALPFLTKMFPNIQFIITTHSPFVISSIDNAVVFDLESKKRVENLTNYSYEGIVEGYFNADTLSIQFRKDFERYKFLVNKTNRTAEEDVEATKLELTLDEVPDVINIDFAAEYSHLKLTRELQ